MMYREGAQTMNNLFATSEPDCLYGLAEAFKAFCVNAGWSWANFLVWDAIIQRAHQAARKAEHGERSPGWFA